MGVVGAFRAGKTGKTIVNGSTITNRDWNATDSGGVLETTNFETQGFYQMVTGIFHATWGIDGDWDANIDTFSDPPGMFPRDDGRNMDLIVNQSDGTGFTFPAWYCESSTVTTTARGLITYSAKGGSQGEYETP